MADIDDRARRQRADREIGERLRLVRDALNYQKIDLAEALGISTQRLHNYETGKRPFDIHVAIKLCGTDKRLTMDYLYRGDRANIARDLVEKLNEAAKRRSRQRREVS